MRKLQAIVLGAASLLLAAAIGLQWRQGHGQEQEQGPPRNAANVPKSIGTTIVGDAATTRGFSWFSADPSASSVVQIVEGTETAAFEEANALTFRGTTEQVEVGDGQTQTSNKAAAAGLKPGTVYTYRVGTGEEGGWSEPAAFVTEADNEKSFTFIHVADSQGETPADFKLWGRTLDKAMETFPDAKLIVHNGDLTENPEDETAWVAFFGEAKRWLASIPLMPVTGNHDETDGKADRFLAHFHLPLNGAGNSIPGTNYSFDYGPVHFAMLNSESNKDEQAEWLDRDLAASEKPWKIVAIHRPAYGGNQTKSIVKKWVPILDKHGVDLVLQGHNHEYSRSYPLKGNEVVSEGEGTVYVTPNASGGKFNEKKEDQFYHAVHFQNGRPMFAGVTVDAERLVYRAYDADGRLLDEFAIARKS